MARVVREKELVEPIHVALGESIVLRLEENPTTGYRWFFEGFPAEDMLVVSDQFRLANDAFGAGGIRELTLQAKRPGEHLIVLRNSFASGPSPSDPETRVAIQAQ
jgi:predicted secreted protein